MAPEAQRFLLSRRTLAIGVPIAGLLLVGFFIYQGFPYAALGERIVSEVQRSQGVRLAFESVAPEFRLAGPGIAASGVRATLRSGEAIRIERVSLRPAWSTAWLRGDRAVYAEVESGDLGNLVGTLVLGETRGFSGDVSDVALDRLPLPSQSLLRGLDGRMDANLDVSLGPAGPEGHASFNARDGSLDLNGFPIAIPFETAVGDLLFGGEAFVAVNRFELEGPLVSASVTGNVLTAASFEQAPLRLEGEIEAKADLKASMQQAGLRVDRNGKAKVRVTGTVAQPNIR